MVPKGTVEEGLVAMSRLSLAELADLDDVAIADACGELLQRRRCGIGPADLYAADKNGSGGGSPLITPDE
jgi:hypothetical protein